MPWQPKEFQQLLREMGAQWVESMKKFGVKYTQEEAEAEFKYFIIDRLASAGDEDVTEIDDRPHYLTGILTDVLPMEISPDPLVGTRHVVKRCRFCAYSKDGHVRDLAVTSDTDPSGHEYCEMILFEI